MARNFKTLDESHTNIKKKWRSKRKKNVIIPNQHGYIAKKSTIIALTDEVLNITKGSTTMFDTWAIMYINDLETNTKGNINNTLKI